MGACAQNGTLIAQLRRHVRLLITYCLQVVEFLLILLSDLVFLAVLLLLRGFAAIRIQINRRLSTPRNLNGKDTLQANLKGNEAGKANENINFTDSRRSECERNSAADSALSSTPHHPTGGVSAPALSEEHGGYESQWPANSWCHQRKEQRNGFTKAKQSLKTSQEKNGASFVDDQAHLMQLSAFETKMSQFIILALKTFLLTLFKFVSSIKARRKALQQIIQFSSVQPEGIIHPLPAPLFCPNSNGLVMQKEKDRSKVKHSGIPLNVNGDAYCALPDSSRVCIVGTGASGLTFAHTLISLGHPPSLIDIYDENSADKVGGQIRSFHHDNRIHEYGAVHVMSTYKTTLQLLNEFNVNYAPLRHVETVLNISWKEKLQFIFGSTGVYMYFCAFCELITKTFPTLEDDPFSVLSKNPLLLLSLEQFLQTFHMDGLSPMLKIATFPMANVTADNVSLGLFLKFLPLSCLQRLVDNYIFGPLYTDQQFTGFYVPAGYNVLMQRMYQAIKQAGVKFHFDCCIQAINTDDPMRPVIHFKNLQKSGDTETKAYDAVVLAAAYSLREGEQHLPGAALFDVVKQMKNVNVRRYMKFHVKIDIHNYPSIRMPLGDLFLAKPTMNGPYLYYNLHDPLTEKQHPEQHISLEQQSPGNARPPNDVLAIICEVDHWWMDRKLMECNIVKSIHSDLGIPLCAIKLFDDYESISFHCISYAPSIEDLKNDYYGKLESVQGMNNVYYSNMLYTIDFSGSVMDYAKKLAYRMKHSAAHRTHHAKQTAIAYANNVLQSHEKTKEHTAAHIPLAMKRSKKIVSMISS